MRATAIDVWEWQRRAHRALDLILEAAKPRDREKPLPAVDWTICDGPSKVIGKVSRIRLDGWTQREAFDAWRSVLELDGYRDHHNSYLGCMEYWAWSEDWGYRRLGRLVTVILHTSIDDPEPSESA